LKNFNQIYENKGDCILRLAKLEKGYDRSLTIASWF